MAGRNAIARRLDTLHDQWVEFSLLPEPRILRWLIRSDEYRMIETFLQKESDDAAGELPDLFLRFAEPFTDVNAYGAALLQALEEQYAVVRQELEAEDIPATWEAPAVAAGTHSLTAFIDTVRSLQQHHVDELEQLVLVLTPATIVNTAEWQRWLDAAARMLPATVRLLVLDDTESPQLESLVADAGPLVHTTRAELDMPAAMLELAGAAGTRGPDGQFRVQFAALSQALGRSDHVAADRAGTAALAVAQENGWTHLVTAVHFALASGLLSAGRALEAVARYGQAETAAIELEKQGDGVGTKLRMQTAFAVGAAYVSAAAWPDGAQAYERAVPLAEAAGEPLMVLDAWRMAAYCAEQTGDVARAWDSGHRALHAAESIPAEQRAHSMLPYAGEALLRLAAASASHRDIVHQRMVGLTGTHDWLPKPPAGAG